jgi:hypothetical protein
MRWIGLITLNCIESITARSQSFNHRDVTQCSSNKDISRFNAAWRVSCSPDHPGRVAITKTLQRSRSADLVRKRVTVLAVTPADEMPTPFFTAGIWILR